VTRDPDAFSIWGDWNLDQFKVQVVRWRDTAHPPAHRFAHVNQWWPRLKQPADRVGAVRVSRENDPEGNLWWMWVPEANWLDHAGYFRVQCFFRSYERENPPRLVCEEFRTVQSDWTG